MDRRSILFMLVSCFLVISVPSIAQISEKDSTVQVIGYWSKNDKQSFLITSDKYSVTGKDTTDRQVTKTEVDVTVIDSTATSYTIEWLYKTIRSNSADPLTQKFYRLAQNVKFVIKTDEMGSFNEVVNVADLQEYAKHTAELLKKDLKGVKDADGILSALLAAFESKESIEAELIDEIYQFYYFHGGKYKLDEPVSMKLELPNASGGKPIDAELVINLSEINAADDNYVIRSSQIVDKAQATEATYQYLRQSNELEEGFTREQMPDVLIEETIGARVHTSGWTTYSIKTRTVTSADTSDIEECTIELQ